MAKSNRIYYLDLLRAIACLSVIMIHSCGSFAVEKTGSFNFWVGNLLDGSSQIAVPLFVMISGALMLDKDYDFSFEKLKKHILRMVAFFVFWSLIYCVVFNILSPVFLKHEALSFKTVFMAFFEGFYHLWFIYLIIGLYLIVPLLRLWVNDGNKKYVEYFLALSLIFTFLLPQTVNIGSNFNGTFREFGNILENDLGIRYVGGYTAYFILGWYLNNYELKCKKTVLFLGLAGLFVTIFGTYLLSVLTHKPTTLYGNLSTNILFQSAALFVLIRDKIGRKTVGNAFVRSVSKYSLGIYAVHAAVVAILYNILEKTSFDNAVIVIPAVFVISFAASYIVTVVLSKLPGLKRFV